MSHETSLSGVYHLPNRVRQRQGTNGVFLLDHLPQMTAALTPIRVPWMGAEYIPSSGGFFDFPDQWGFSLDGLLRGDFVDHGLREGLAFLQTWLFFGLLKEGLGNEDRIVPEHWIANYNNPQATQKYMISPYLRSYLIRIDRRLKNPHPLRPPLRHWIMVFRFTIDVAEAFDKAFAQRCKAEDVDQHDPLKITWSILMLGQILTNTIMKCYRVETSDFKHWPDGTILHLRMSRQLECPHRCNKLMALFAMDAIYSLTLLQFHGTVSRYASLPQETNVAPLSFPSLYDEDPALGRGRHRNCTVQRCLAEKIDPSSYQSAHSNSECDCAFLGPDVQRVIEILDDTEIPAFVVRERTSLDGVRSLFIEVVRAKHTSGYVAISHVWADGLGNSLNNQLHRCQIVRLARLVCALTGREAQPFWIDTFGIPRDLEQRKKGLAVMEPTYRLAEKVLVLDGGLQQHVMYRMIEDELAGADAETAEQIRVGVALELLLRIVCCSWTSRLWTLPEGMLGPELHFQFSDGTVELGDLVAQLRTWPFIGTNIVKDIISVLVRLRPKLRTQSRRGLAPPDPLMLNWPHGDAYGQFITMFQALEFRDTTWPEDEATCLAIHLNLNLQAILSRDYPERLEAFFAQLDQIPADLMFTHGEHIPRYPYRWAPLHLLEYKDNYVCIPAATIERPMGIRTDRGLLVQFGCFKLRTKNERVPNTKFIFFSIQGTSDDGVECPINYIMHIAALDPRNAPNWRQSKTHQILTAGGVTAECLYLILGPDGVQGPPMCSGPGRLGLIVQRVSEEDGCVMGVPLDTVAVFEMPGSRIFGPNSDSFTHWHADEVEDQLFCIG